MTETTKTPTADLTGAGELYDADRRYIAVTLTPELRDAVYAAVRASIAAGTPTTGGLLLRDIVAKHLNVTIDVTRAPNGAPKSDADKRADRISVMARTAGLLAQHTYDQAHPDATVNDPARVAAFQNAYDKKAAALRAADEKKRAAAMTPAEAKADAMAAADATTGDAPTA